MSSNNIYTPKPLPSIGGYPTAAPSLSASEVYDFGSQLNNASSNYSHALAQRDYQGNQANLNLGNQLRQIGRTANSNAAAAGTTYAGQGKAFDPMFMGKALTGIAQNKADSVAQAQSDNAAKLAALDQMVNQAQLDRQTTMGQIAAQKALAQASVNNLINKVQGYSY